MEPIKEFNGNYRFLSNFYHAPVCVSGIDYLNTEAAYQAGKTLDMDVRAEFSSLDPSTAKKKGRYVELRADWDVVKIEIMELCLRAKFMKHPDLAEKLIATGNAKLIEGNHWGDTIWGVSLKTGKGKNLLGKLLMNIREDLQWKLKV